MAPRFRRRKGLAQHIFVSTVEAAPGDALSGGRAGRKRSAPAASSAKIGADRAERLQPSVQARESFPAIEGTMPSESAGCLAVAASHAIRMEGKSPIAAEVGVRRAQRICVTSANTLMSSPSPERDLRRRTRALGW
jgi:hypothetical protein